MSQTDRTGIQRATIRDVRRYDVAVHLSAYVLGCLWIFAGILFALEWTPDGLSDGQTEAIALIAGSGLAWLLFADWRARVLNRTLESGRPMVGRVELSLHSGHWLRVLVSFDLDGRPSERSVALPAVATALRISRGDAISLMVGSQEPSRIVLVDLLFPASQDSHPPEAVTNTDPDADTEGAQRPADLLIDGMFHRTASGALVFRPWSRSMRGYVLESEDQRTRLRRATSVVWHAALIGGFVGMAFGAHGIDVPESGLPGLLRISGFALLGVMPPAALYSLWVLGAVRGLEHYHGPPTPLSEQALQAARSHQGELRFTTGLCAVLSAALAGASLMGAPSPGLLAVLALICFAGALAFARQGRIITERANGPQPHR